MRRDKRRRRQQQTTKKEDIHTREMEILEEMHEMYQDMIAFNHKLENSLIKRMDFMQNKMEEYEKLKEIECKNEEETLVIKENIKKMDKADKADKDKEE